LIIEVIARALLQSGRALLLPIALTVLFGAVAYRYVTPPWIYAPHQDSQSGSFLVPRSLPTSEKKRRLDEIRFTRR
jgi:hypothetical protein